MSLCLVTGSAGHLGNNLVRLLLEQGHRVRAGVRNTDYRVPFEGLNCEVVYADFLDRSALQKAMEGVEVVYHVAAVFTHWAKDPQKDIIQPNLDGTQNILETAAKAGVGKVVYVSSMAALDHHVTPMRETTWNTDFSNRYYQAKTQAEQLAWQLNDTLGLDLVTALPSSMVGPNSYGHMTTTMGLLNNILTNQLSFDPNFFFNFVDVKDVAQGLILAAQRGRSGQRYLLGTRDSIGTTELIAMAKAMYPDVRQPKRVSKGFLLGLAGLMEFAGRISGKPPLMLRTNVKMYYKADASLDISKAQNELGYRPAPPRRAIGEAFRHLMSQ